MAARKLEERREIFSRLPSREFSTIFAGELLRVSRGCIMLACTCILFLLLPYIQGLS